jgi:hypothetical protein
MECAIGDWGRGEAMFFAGEKNTRLSAGIDGW